MTHEFKFEYIILGETSVGKSSILKRFTDKEFSDLTEATVGIDFGVSSIVVKNKKIKVYTWDTAGQETYLSLVKFYIRNRAAAIIVYDITNYRSFEKVQKWVDFVREVASNEIIIILVGNKSDLASLRQVPTNEAEKYSKINNLIFFETSAKASNEGCRKIFEVAANITLERIESGKIDPENEIFGVKYGPMHKNYKAKHYSSDIKDTQNQIGSWCCLF